MNILVADSGSTKCNWIYKIGSESATIQTIGLNPLFISSEGIAEVIKQSGLKPYLNQIEAIYFYGASCSSAARNKVVEDGLKMVFSNATIIQVDHDIKAACLATCGDQAGIVTILGTGANSCVWDGKAMVESIEAPGFILGDEASGAYFGKKLLALYLYKRLPAAISDYIKTHYHGEKDDIYRAVYQEKFPNQYLASYAKVYSAFKEEPIIQNLLREGFEEFIEYHLLPFSSIKSMPVHVVGSVGYHFRDIFTKALEGHGIQSGKFMPNPIESLLEWHLRGNN